MLDARESKFFVPAGPFPPKPKGVIEVIEMKDKIPHGLSSYYNGSHSSTHFIWRTQADDRVRREHLKFEGQIFPNDNPDKPQAEWGCRCYAEPVPSIIKVIDVTGAIKSLDSFLRYGGGGTFVLRA